MYNQSNEAWDASGGLPDPFVALELDGFAFYKTSTKQDTLMPVWNEQMMSVIAPASTITVSVMDADLGDDDLMFSCEDRAMTAASLRDGMTCFGTGALAAAHVDLKFLTQ